MREPVRPAAELMTVSLLCPLWGQVAEVSVVCDERGFVAAVGCPLSTPGTACLAPCEAEIRRWWEYAGQGWWAHA